MKVQSTSRHHAIGEDIELRKTATTRLIFRPEIVDNVKNREAPIRGTFIFQKKKISGNWEDYQTGDLSTLKDAEGVNLLLHSSEVLTLLQGLQTYKEIYEKHGILFGENHFTLTSGNVSEVINQLSGYTDLPLLIEKLKELKVENLQALDSLVGVSSLKKIYSHWLKEKDNSDEDYWHKLFKKYPWILSQIFPYTVTMLGDKMYVGGKSIDNTGSGVIDFLFKKDLLDSVVLIEIKTPSTPLVGPKYRDNAYSISTDLTGTVNQVLAYKEGLTREYAAIALNSEKQFGVFNPRTIVIAGSLENEKLTKAQKKSFEMFRCDLRNVEIITFDELFNRIKHIIDLVQGIK